METCKTSTWCGAKAEAQTDVNHAATALATTAMGGHANSKLRGVLKVPNQNKNMALNGSVNSEIH